MDPEILIYHELSKTIGKLSSLAVYHQIRSAVVFGKKHVRNKFLNILFVVMQGGIFFVKKPSIGGTVISGFVAGVIAR